MITCPLHHDRPADAAFSGTCSRQCEAEIMQRMQRPGPAPAPMPRLRASLDGAHCSCGAPIHAMTDRNGLVRRCVGGCFVERLSANALQHIVAA